MSRRGQRSLRGGFSLIEVLIAVVILGSAFIVIWRTFAATMDGWTRGTKFLEQMHHADFVMDQLSSALRSAAFYPTKPEKYGFWLDAKGGEYPKDKVSWVTSSSAFIPPDSPFVNGLHRIQVTIDDNEDGDDSFTVTAWSHFADMEEMDDPETYHITTKVRGIECEVYDWENETWDDEWEDTNAVPSLIRVTLYVEPAERYDPPMKISRLIELPIAPAVTGAVASTDAPAPAEGAPAGNGAPTRNEVPIRESPSQGASTSPGMTIGGASR